MYKTFRDVVKKLSKLDTSVHVVSQQRSGLGNLRLLGS
jgi:hypothetical protein